MNKQRNQIKRENLHFVDAVKKAFNFLIYSYDMQCVASTSTNVRYQNESIYINIYHEYLSYELGIRIGRLADDSCRSYGLEEVLRALAGEIYNCSTFLQASCANKIQKSIMDLAVLVEKYYGPLLRNDSEAFECVASTSCEIGTQNEKEITLKNIRMEADKAWKHKEYTKIVKLYTSIKPELTKSENAKLEYAIKKLCNRSQKY